MYIRIYQINTSRDQNRQKFHGFAALGGQPVDASIYDEVFAGELFPKEGQNSIDPEEIYRRFNTEGHPLHRGHSLSISDVVELEDRFYFCDSVGFREIDFNPTLTQKQDNLMRVVYVEPGRPPYVAEIEQTLKGEQKAVGGLIEPIYYADGICLVGNEEAKLIGMAGNRRLDGIGIIAGPFFVCGLTETGDEFRSLTDEEAGYYMEHFAEPEEISQEEVEADTGFMIYGMY
mgnify:CR=1 FL=1